VFGKHNIIRAHQLENQLMTLSPNDFPCIEDYLSKFKTLIPVYIDCKTDMKEDRCIYVILAKIGSGYIVFVSTFYSTREALGSYYKEPSLEYFCDSMIQEQYKLVQLGLIITTGISNKSLVAQQKDKYNNSKKQHPHHNNKGLKPSQKSSTPNHDKGEKSKSKKINGHCNFCGKDGHVESKRFKNMDS
jgi:hypothetical protein